MKKDIKIIKKIPKITLLVFSVFLFLVNTVASKEIEPENVARQWLKENYKRFQMKEDLTDLSLEYIQQIGLWGAEDYRVKFSQTYRGLSVFNSGIAIYLNSKGVRKWHNYYVPNIDLPIYPELSSSQVVEIAKKDYLANYERRDKRGKPIPVPAIENVVFRKEPRPELGIFKNKKDGIVYLSYRLYLSVKSPIGSYEYIIDANSGEILQRVNLVQT